MSSVLGRYICLMTEKELLSVDRESFHFLFKKVGEIRAAEVRPESEFRVIHNHIPCRPVVCSRSAQNRLDNSTSKDIAHDIIGSRS